MASSNSTKLLMREGTREDGPENGIDKDRQYTVTTPLRALISPAQTFPLSSRITSPAADLTSSLGCQTRFSNLTSQTELFAFKSCSLKSPSIRYMPLWSRFPAWHPGDSLTSFLSLTWHLQPSNSHVGSFTGTSSESSSPSATAPRTPWLESLSSLRGPIGPPASTLVPTSSVSFQLSSQNDAIKTQIVTCLHRPFMVAHLTLSLDSGLQGPTYSVPPAGPLSALLSL